MYVRGGKQREAGLGRAPEKKAQDKKSADVKAKDTEVKDAVSLKAARDKAAEGRAFIRAGLDPIAEWNKPNAQQVPTFGEAADDFLAAHKGGWRNEKHKAQWTMTLGTYCEPIRKTLVNTIDTEAVLSVLKPLLDAGTGNGVPPSRPRRSGPGRGQGARLHWPQRGEPGALARPSRQAPAEAI
jgi:Phage integrase central domain